MNSKRLSAGLVIGVLAIQGCGGDDGSRTVSNPDFIAQGNQICVATIKRQAATYERIISEAEGTQVTVAEGKRAEQELADVVAASVQAMIGEFEDIGTPAGKEEAVSKMLKEYAKGAEETKADPQVFLQAKAFVDADKSAKILGLTKCEKV